MPNNQTPSSIKISPSDLTYLYHSCKRCFYLKYKYKISQPGFSGGINSTLDSLFKNYFNHKSISTFIKNTTQQGIIIETGRTISSKTISHPGKMDCYLEGKYDALIEFDDQTYGVVDFKASKYSQGKEETYKRQLQAYQYAFLHPQNGQQRQISKIGLLFLYPNNLQDSQNSLSMSLTQHWIEILYDENDFLTFIHEVQDLLSSPKTPPPTKDCPYCKFVSETSNL